MSLLGTAAQHLQKSGIQLRDSDDVHQFLQIHLLHWLEALVWMRNISEGIVAIQGSLSKMLLAVCVTCSFAPPSTVLPSDLLTSEKM